MGIWKRRIKEKKELKNTSKKESVKKDEKEIFISVGKKEGIQRKKFKGKRNSKEKIKRKKKFLKN